MVYVQDKMRTQGAALWSLIEDHIIVLLSNFKIDLKRGWWEHAGVLIRPSQNIHTITRSILSSLINAASHHTQTSPTRSHHNQPSKQTQNLGHITYLCAP